MTPKQTQLYWREWNAAKKAARQSGSDLTDSDRYTLMEEALADSPLADRPSPISSKNLTNEDLDKVLAAFRAISRPASLNSQLRAQAMPKTRLLHRIAQQLQLLALFVDHPCNYAKSILQDRFKTAFLEDLSADPGSNARAASIRERSASDDAPPDSALAMMRNTLAARLSKLRRRGVLSDQGRARAQNFGYHEAFGTVLHPLLDLTEHDINQMAGLPCHCTACSKNRRINTGLQSGAPSPQTPETVSTVSEDNIPF